MKQRATNSFLQAAVVSTASFLFTAQQVLAQAADPFGSIDKPPGVDVISQRSGVGVDEIPVLYFISLLIRMSIIIAGVWAVLNFLLAGWGFIGSGGNAQAHTTARDRMVMTVLGLLLMTTVYTIAGVIGLVFFGDASFILNPQLKGPVPL